MSERAPPLQLSSRKKRKPPKRASFGLLPRDIMYERPRQWRAFDLAVACALVARARWQLADERVTQAWQSGRDAIEQERQYAASHKEQWRRVNKLRRDGVKASAPLRKHSFGNSDFKAGKLSKTLKQAGRVAHKRALDAARQARPPQTVELAISRFSLLRLARLSTDGRNLAALDLSMKLLSKPVWINAQRKTALIRSLSTTDGILRAEIAGVWLEPPFGRVPLPIPTRSTIAATLYLLLQNFRTSGANQRGIDFQQLCRRIGIDITKPQFVCRQAFNRAFDLVNRHVARLSDKRLRQHGMQPLSRYEIEAQGNSVKFTAISRPSKEEQEAILVEAGAYDYPPDELAPPPARVRRSRSIRDQARELMGLPPVDE